MLLPPPCPLAGSASKMRAETHCFAHARRKANSMGQKVVESMTAIERTIYPRFTRTPSAKEVRALYTPVPADRAFVEKHARGPAQKFSLMIMLKVLYPLKPIWRKTPRAGEADFCVPRRILCRCPIPGSPAKGMH